MKLKILIADDHQIVRDGVRSLLESSESDFDIVGEASNGREAISKVRKLKPDIVLMDISMPELNGIEAVKHIASETPSCCVIALSMHTSSEFVTGMLGAGAKGYIHKDVAFAELHDAIRAVAAGDVYLGNGVASAVVDDYQRIKSVQETGPATELSAREREVLQLVAEGRRTKEIADLLSVSVKTVETHRAQILRKLELGGIAEITKYAIRHGLISLDS